MKTNKNPTRLKFSFAIFMACLINTLSVTADDGQVFWRFMGLGWGNGYHAYPPHCTHPPFVPSWMDCGPNCTDRYSLPNTGGCLHYGNRGCAPCQSYQIHPAPQLLPPPLQRSGPQQDYLPTQSNPIDRGKPHSPTDRLPGLMLPADSLKDPRVKPSDETLPPLTPGKNNPEAPPINSGTTSNPFGVSINYISPQPAIQQNRPMNSFQSRIAYPFPRRKYQPISPSRIRHSSSPLTNRASSKRTQPNTFNGIR